MTDQIDAEQRSEIRWTRWLLAIAVLAMCFSLVFSQIRSAQTRHIIGQIATVTDDTHELVKFVRAQTSPEAQQTQQQATSALIAELVAKLDCSGRGALQDALDGLAAQGLIQPVHVACATPSP